MTDPVARSQGTQKVTTSTINPLRQRRVENMSGRKLTISGLKCQRLRYLAAELVGLVRLAHADL